ncbi:hypothetical protein D3C83_70610 [compost metagenome]
MLPASATEPSIAKAIRRRRPKRIAASLPSTLAAVPISASAVSTKVGASSEPVAPVASAT